MKSAIRSVSFIWVFGILGALFAFLLQVVLARSLEPASLGVIATQIALCGMFAPIAGLGIGQYWLLASGRKEEGEWKKKSLAIYLHASPLVLIILVIAGLAYGDSLFWYQILFLSLHVLSLTANELIIAQNQASGRFIWVALWQFVPNFLRFALIFAVTVLSVYVGSDLITFISFAYAVVAIFSVCYLIFSQSLQDRKGLFKYGLIEMADFSVIRKDAMPFALGALFYFIYFQGDLLLVGVLLGMDSAGYYSVALTVIIGILIFPNSVYQRYLLPHLHVLANLPEKKNEMYSIYKRGNVLMLGLGLGVVLLGYLFVDILVSGLFGSVYDESLPVLKLLLLSIPFIFVASSAGAPLATSGNMKVKVKIMGVVAALSFLGNFILIPYFELMAVAYVKIVCNALLMILYVYYANKNVFGLVVRK